MSCPILLEPTPGCRTGAGGFTTHDGSFWAFPPFSPGGSPGSPSLNGVLGRNIFRAPATANLDFALSKSIELGETRRLVIRGEGFNILNTPQFGIPQNLLEAPAFGQEVRTIAPARTVQLAIKFSF